VAASAGDTATIEGTLDAALQNLDDAREVAGDESQREGEPEEAVADKGYHSKMVLLSLQQEGWRTYIAEPQRGRQKWPAQEAERAAVYANRRRKNGRRGLALMRLRGELIERPFAHAFETGGMRRTHLRHHENIAKRLLVHVAGLNLALLMRTRFGVGKPRCLQGRSAALGAAAAVFLRLLRDLWHQMRSALGVESLWPTVAVSHVSA
jgi:hypothetical protein